MLERSIRLVYLAASSSKQAPKDIETLLKPIVDAIRKKDAAAAHKAVTADIAHGQLNALGRDFWGDASVSRESGQNRNKEEVMPVYRQLGEIPSKRHKIFRKPSGELYAEELMGNIGFTGPSSLVYHVHAPTGGACDSDVIKAGLLAAR